MRVQRNTAGHKHAIYQVKVSLIDAHAKLIDLHLVFTWTDTQKSTALSVVEMH